MLGASLLGDYCGKRLLPRDRGMTSIATLGLIVFGVGALSVGIATMAEESDPPSYATQRLLDGGVGSGMALAGPDVPLTDESDEVEKPVEAETRAERIQRVLRQDGEMAARLVPIIMAHRNDIPDATAYDVSLAIARESRQNDLRPELVAALIEVESNYRVHVSSPTNDHGLMQLHGERIYDITQNIALGCQELATWRETYKCDEREMLAHYNGGCNPPGQSWRYADKVLSLADGE